ncbi:MAG: CoA-transferase [Chloroflexota bacterium]
MTDSDNPTVSFTDIEATVCHISRMIEEDKLYFVQMAGAPLMALLMGKRLYAPNVGYVVEEGAVCPDPEFPLPRMMLGSSGVHYRAVQWTSMLMVDSHAALGFMDYGLLAALQVDRFGNFNSTHIGGTYDKPERRFGGPGGANEIASQCWRTIIMTKLQKRKFVEKCDFVSSPGYLDGTPGARERAGLPSGTGPWRIVTAEAMFGFVEATHEMRLDAIAPWITVEEVLTQMDFRPLIADKLGVMQIPGEQELKMIRADIDPSGLSTGRGEWMTIDCTTGKRAG